MIPVIVRFRGTAYILSYLFSKYYITSTYLKTENNESVTDAGKIKRMEKEGQPFINISLLLLPPGPPQLIIIIVIITVHT